MEINKKVSFGQRIANFFKSSKTKEQEKLQKIAFETMKKMDETNDGKNFIVSTPESFESLKPAEKLKLERRQIALNYRSGESQKDSNVIISESFKQQANEWKKKQGNGFRFGGDKQVNGSYLTAIDMRNLNHAARYTEFMSFLEKPENKALRELFFKWVLRDHGSVRAFITLPHIYEKINKSVMATRLGKFKAKRQERIVKQVITKGRTGYQDGKIFKLANNVASIAFVNAKGEKKFCSLMDDKAKIKFGFKGSFTVGSVMKQFENKKHDVMGNFEMYETGINAFSNDTWTKLTARGDQKIDLTKNEWWEQLPVFESFTAVEAQEKFGLTEGRWGVHAVASCEEKGVKFEGNHAYKIVLIPNKTGGYNAYPIGTFVKQFPNGTLAKLGFLTKTVEGALHYADQNEFVGPRRREGVTFSISEETGKEYMNLQRRKLAMSLDQNQVGMTINKMEQFKLKAKDFYTERRNKFNARRLDQLKKYAKTLNVPDLFEGLDETISSENFYRDLADIVAKYPFKGLAGWKTKRLLLNRIKRDQENGNRFMNEKTYAFNLAVYSCAWNVQEELEELFGKQEEGGQIPNLFSVKLAKSDAPSILKPMVVLCRCLPGFVARGFALAMGSRRKFETGQDETGKSLYRDMHSEFKRNGECIMSPGWLMNNIVEGKIKRQYVLQD